MDKIKLIGYFSTLAGVFLVINSYTNMTGSTIGISLSSNLWGLISLILIVGGIVIATHRTSKIPGLDRVVEVSAEQETSSEHDVAHNYANYQKLREFLDRRKDTTPTIRVSDVEINEYREKYGQPPVEDNKPDWVVLYHAYPNDVPRTQGIFIDRRKTKGKGFFMSDDPINASLETGLAESDISIQKIMIARAVYDDLQMDTRLSHISGGAVYKISPEKIELANKLCRTGYIKLSRGR